MAYCLNVKVGAQSGSKITTWFGTVTDVQTKNRKYIIISLIINKNATNDANFVTRSLRVCELRHSS